MRKIQHNRYVLSTNNGNLNLSKYSTVIAYVDISSSITKMVQNLPSNIKLIIVSSKIENISNVFSQFWKETFIYTVVISVDNSPIASYYGSPFIENNCGATMSYRKIKPNTDLFQTSYDLKNCVITVLLLKILLPRSGNNSIFDAVLEFIAKKLHFEVKYVDKDILTELEIFNRGSVDDKNFSLNNADMMLMGLFYSKIFHERFSQSKIYYFGNNMWVVRKPGPLPNYKILLSIFSLTTWFLCLIVILISTVLLYAISGKINQTLDSCFVTILALNLGVSQTNSAQSVTLRIFILFFVIYAMYISIYFQAQLSGILTTPTLEPGINSVQDLAFADNKVSMLGLDMNYLKDLNISIVNDIDKMIY